MRQQVDDLVRTATYNITNLLEIKWREWGAAAGKLHALSPLAVLDRGYSITFKDGKVVKEAAKLQKGDLLETRLSKGNVRSKVEEVKKK